MLQARLEDHRRQKAEQEVQQGERETARQQIRAQLEARTKWLRAPDAILRALGVPLEMDPGNPFRIDIAKTVRKCRLTYHPDRHQVCSFSLMIDLHVCMSKSSTDDAVGLPFQEKMAHISWSAMACQRATNIRASLRGRDKFPLSGA